MTNESQRLSRRTLLTAAIGGAAVGVVGSGVLSGTAFAAAQGRKRLLIGTVRGMGDGSLWVADPELTGTPAEIKVSGPPNHIAGTPDGSHVFVSTQFTPGLALVDLEAGKVVTEFPVGGFAGSTVVSADGKRVYVAVGSSGGGGTRGYIAVLDADSGEVRARIKAGVLPKQLALTPDGKRLFVGDEYAPGISVIDTDKNEVTGSLKTEKTALRLEVDDKGRKLFVASAGELATFDPASGSQNGTVELIGRPGGLGVSPSGALAVVSVYTGRSKPALLFVVNGNSLKVIAQNENGRAHGPLVLSKDGGKAFVIDKENRRANSADTSTGRPDKSLSTPNDTKPTAVAFVETA